jgi:hypothetical protein
LYVLLLSAMHATFPACLFFLSPKQYLLARYTPARATGTGRPWIAQGGIRY